MLFSIVIPTYNNAKLLQRALNSISLQSFSNYEVIVVDNFSTDNTESVIQRSNIKNLIYKKIKNEGVISKSRNLGIEISKGDWIHFLDSDDTLHKEKIKFLTENISSKYDITCNSQKIIDEDSNSTKIWNYGPYEQDFYRKLLINGNRFSTTASVIKKEFLDRTKIRFNERKDFVTAEDYDFFLNLVDAGAKVKFFNEVLGTHYKYEGSQSSNYEVHKNSIKNVVKHHVYNIQKFSHNKDKLWAGLQWRFELLDFLNNLKKKKYVLSSFTLLKIILKSPLKLTDFFLFKLKKKLKY